MSRNRLSEATSPYLIQHRENPVHWWPWCKDALDEAKTTGKPILLSVGYAACHWCHVMAHESFEDQETADVMNELFVNIKVDREERPDIDQIYMTALHALGEQGGWPLTMFLTSDAKPFWGGTYFPKTANYGRPSFKQVLIALADAYQTKPDQIEQNRSALEKHLRGTTSTTASQPLLEDHIDEVAKRLVSIMDIETGGTRGAPKFPQASLLNLFWDAAISRKNASFKNIVLKTLTAISLGGIYDHLGGGIARYTVDQNWLVPHFEKMLYDNAQFITLLTASHAIRPDQLFRKRIEETVDWLGRDMRDSKGGFYSSYDADSEGVEGKFYVWTKTEIEELLGTDAEAFCETYDVTPNGNWEGQAILNRTKSGFSDNEDLEERLERCRIELLAHRNQRIWPGLDDKILADWNGLTVSALANAAFLFNNAKWLHLAKTAYEFILDEMRNGGRLGHSHRDQRTLHPGLATDYATMIAASLDLHQATATQTCLSTAIDLQSLIDHHHWDEENGGYFLSADDTDDLIMRPKFFLDESTPNHNGTMVSNLTRLSALTGKTAYLERADRCLQAASSTMLENPFSTTSLWLGFSLRLSMATLVIVAADENPVANEIRAIAMRQNVTLLRVGDTKDIPANHPAYGKTAVDDRATYYLCKNNSCSLPVTDVNQLIGMLEANN